MTLLPEVVGILNVTPDSFSDGGIFASGPAALKRAEHLFLAGAAVVDVGAESTRPHATPLTAEAEWDRLKGVLSPLVGMAEAAGKTISVDTRHESTALRALDCGVSWINAVSGEASLDVIGALQQYDARIVLMHSCGLPAHPQRHLPRETDPVSELSRWIDDLLVRVADQGLSIERVIVDPGIGFGKEASQSLTLLRRASELVRHHVDVMIGHSRKSFMTLFTDRPAPERDLETHCISFFLCSTGVQYLRVHDVEGTMRALKTYESLHSPVAHQNPVLHRDCIA